MKKLLNSLLITTIIFFSSIIILTIINYFNIINYKVLNIIKLFIPIISIFLGALNIGKKSLKNGWLQGIKLSTIISIILIITTFILKKFKAEYLIYILVLTITGSLGSMIGINKK